MLKRVQHDRLFGLLYRSSEKTQCSLLTAQKRLKDVDTNSRGLSSLRYFNVRILVASVKTRIGNSHRTSASSRRHFFFLSIIPRVQEPAAIRPTGFPSSRRFFPTNIYHNVMLNLFNFVQFAHVDFVFLLLTRHSMQASSALASFVGSA